MSDQPLDDTAIAQALQALIDQVIRDNRQVRAMPSPEIFNLLANLTPQVAIELALIQHHLTPVPHGQTSVYLTKRPETAPTHPDMWHVPGGFLRRGQSFAEAIEAIRAADLADIGIVSAQCVGQVNNHLDPAHHSVSLVHLCQFKGILPVHSRADWFNCNDLPEPLCPHHQKIIALASAHFRPEAVTFHPTPMQSSK